MGLGIEVAKCLMLDACFVGKTMANWDFVLPDHEPNTKHTMEEPHISTTDAFAPTLRFEA
jgi:hypothetical protein